MQRRGVAWLLASAALLCCPSAALGSIDAALETFNGAWPQGCAQVTIEQAEDPDPTVSGFATPGTCVVYLTPRFLASQPAPELVCAVVVHEFGHLLGLDHSADEANVMFASPLPPPACQTDATTATAASDRAQVAGDVPAIAGSRQRTTGSEVIGSKTRSRTCSRARARASTKRSSAQRRSALRRARRSGCKG